MANDLLRYHKDKVTTKLQLALFTSSPDDNLELAAEVAKLETDLARLSLSQGLRGDALTCLVAAAVAHRARGELVQALGLLTQAHNLKKGDAETEALLLTAIKDLRLELYGEPPAAPEPPPAPEPAIEVVETDPVVIVDFDEDEPSADESVPLDVQTHEDLTESAITKAVEKDEEEAPKPRAKKRRSKKKP
jgi:hypothetical protein